MPTSFTKLNFTFFRMLGWSTKVSFSKNHKIHITSWKWIQNLTQSAVRLFHPIMPLLTYRYGWRWHADSRRWRAVLTWRRGHRHMWPGRRQWRIVWERRVDVTAVGTRIVHTRIHTQLSRVSDRTTRNRSRTHLFRTSHRHGDASILLAPCLVSINRWMPGVRRCCSLSLVLFRIRTILCGRNRTGAASSVSTVVKCRSSECG